MAPSTMAIDDETTQKAGVAHFPTMNPRIRQRRESVHEDRARRRVRWYYVAGGALGLLVLLVLVAHSPFLSARVVRVTGDHSEVSTRAILEAGGLAGHPPMITVNPATSEANIEALPYIRTATVVRHWPDAVDVAVTERHPVAEMAGPGRSWSLVDPTGRTVAVVATTVAGTPVLSIRTAHGPLVPAQLGQAFDPPAANGLVVAAALPPAFVDQVLKVTEAPNGSVTLLFAHNITVRIGSTALLAQKIQATADVLAGAHLYPGAVINVTVPSLPTVAPS
jgi:cell division protein FtsQ